MSNGIVIKKHGGREVLHVGLQWEFLSEEERKMLCRVWRANGGSLGKGRTVLCASVAVATSVLKGITEVTS